MNEILDREDFFYVYRVTGRKDGMEYAVQPTAQPGRILALFALATDCQLYVDALRQSLNLPVHVMPSAQGIVT